MPKFRVEVVVKEINVVYLEAADADEAKRIARKLASDPTEDGHPDEIFYPEDEITVTPAA